MYVHEHAEANPHKNSGMALLIAGHAGKLATGMHTKTTGTIGDLFLTVADDVLQANIGNSRRDTEADTAAGLGRNGAGRGVILPAQSVLKLEAPGKTCTPGFAWRKLAIASALIAVPFRSTAFKPARMRSQATHHPQFVCTLATRDFPV